MKDLEKFLKHHHSTQVFGRATSQLEHCQHKLISIWTTRGEYGRLGVGERVDDESIKSSHTYVAV